MLIKIGFVICLLVSFLSVKVGKKIAQNFNNKKTMAIFGENIII